MSKHWTHGYHLQLNSLCIDPNISALEYRMLVVMLTFQNYENDHQFGTQYLVNLLNVSKTSVLRTVQSLLKKGYIKITRDYIPQTSTPRSYALCFKYSVKKVNDTKGGTDLTNPQYLKPVQASTHNDTSPVCRIRRKELNNKLNKNKNNIYCRDGDFETPQEKDLAPDGACPAKQDDRVKDSSKRKELKPTQLVKDVIGYLNEKANTKYSPNTKATIGQINARAKDGYKLQDFKQVIDTKCKDWLGGEHQIYLRPQTLFSPQHFESYLNQTSIESKGSESELDRINRILGVQ